jgi:hypothetical protein
MATETRRVQLGRVSATPAALRFCEERDVDLVELLRRHALCEWGDVDAEDRRANEQALRDGTRVLSSFRQADGAKLWIITDGLSDACPACWAGIGACEPEKGSRHAGLHFRDDLPPRRLTTTVLLPSDY